MRFQSPPPPQRQPRAPWRAAAFLLLPRLKPLIERSDHPWALWLKLRSLHQAAYRAIPADEELIVGIFKYAFWSCSQKPGESAEDDLGTIVATSFFEHLPTDPRTLGDIPRWFLLEHIEHPNSVFRHHLSDDQWQQLLSLMRRERHKFDAHLAEPPVLDL